MWDLGIFCDMWFNMLSLIHSIKDFNDVCLCPWKMSTNSEIWKHVLMMRAACVCLGVHQAIFISRFWKALRGLWGSSTAGWWWSSSSPLFSYLSQLSYSSIILRSKLCHFLYIFFVSMSDCEYTEYYLLYTLCSDFKYI